MLFRADGTGGQNQKLPLPSWPGEALPAAGGLAALRHRRACAGGRLPARRCGTIHRRRGFEPPVIRRPRGRIE
jgi:hypothetical protein